MSITKRNAAYKPVRTEEEDPIDIQFKPRPQKEDKWVALLERIGSIVHSLIWLGLAATAWYYAEIHKSYSDPRLRPIPLSIALLLGFIATCCFLYVFLDNYFYDRQNTDYLESYPRSITVLTFTGLAFWITLLIAVFPIWGWKTIPIIFVNFMALIMSVNLIPL